MKLMTNWKDNAFNPHIGTAREKKIKRDWIDSRREYDKWSQYRSGFENVKVHIDYQIREADAEIKQCRKREEKCYEKFLIEFEIEDDKE